MEGWVKLWRKTIKNGWLRNHKLWVFWTYCLMKASGIDTEEIAKYNKIKLKRGQFIFGLEKAAKELNMSIKSIRTCIKALESWNNIGRETGKQFGNRFSVITVLNYNSYNAPPDKKGKQNGKQRASRGQAGGNIKEEEERLKNKYSDFVYLSTQEFNKLALRLGRPAAEHWIERLNNYIGSKGKKYKSHYHTILNWAGNQFVPEEVKFENE